MKNLIILIAAIVLSSNAFAQTNRCKTSEIRKQQIKEHPEMLEKIKEIEAFTKHFAAEYNQSQNKTRAVVTLPIVFHVIYSNAAENISDAQILSQMQVLNDDFRKLNSNFSSTPTAFQPVAADCEIEFCLATKDPSGNPTNGITRTATTVTKIGDGNNWNSTANGGKTGWDNKKYINVWVCDMDDNLGFAYPPGSAPSRDGIVNRPSALGTIGSAANSQPNHLGRTLTHEMGHYLNLEHVWGLNGGCNDDDLVGDTPLQDQNSQFCPSFPLFDNCTATGNGIMYCNYLDYSDDVCMTMFTQGQKVRMLAAISGPRATLLTSNSCGTNVAVRDYDLNNLITVFPNPTSNNLQIKSTSADELNLSLYNLMGQPIKTISVKEGGSMNLSEVAAGIYYLNFTNSTNTHGAKKVVITK